MLTSSEVVLMLLVQGPHFENHWSTLKKYKYMQDFLGSRLEKRFLVWGVGSQWRREGAMTAYMSQWFIQRKALQDLGSGEAARPRKSGVQFHSPSFLLSKHERGRNVIERASSPERTRKTIFKVALWTKDQPWCDRSVDTYQERWVCRVEPPTQTVTT